MTIFENHWFKHQLGSKAQNTLPATTNIYNLFTYIDTTKKQAQSRLELADVATPVTT